jgi:hypothetical protein
MFGSLKISSDIWVMAKESYKTKPYGVRFEKGILEKLEKEQNILTPQKALNFLSAHYLTSIKEKEELQNRINALEAQISTQKQPDDTKYQNNVKDAKKWTAAPSGVKVQDFNAPQKTNYAINTEKHPLWKEGDPKENSGGFMLRYGVANYDELEKLQK